MFTFSLASVGEARGYGERRDRREKVRPFFTDFVCLLLLLRYRKKVMGVGGTAKEAAQGHKKDKTLKKSRYSLFQ